MRWVKPLDQQAILDVAQCRAVITVEDGVVSGGAGEGVMEILQTQGISVKSAVLGIPDTFVEQGNVNQLFADLGIDALGIANQVRMLLNDSHQ